MRQQHTDLPSSAQISAILAGSARFASQTTSVEIQERFASGTDRKREIRNALESLSPDQQKVVYLYYAEELTKPQIAAVIGKPLSVTEDLYRRARKAIRDRLTDKTSPETRASEKVLKHARETFGSAAKTEHWLNRPNGVFQGKTPLQAMKSDPAVVEVELTRIDHGVYI